MTTRFGQTDKQKASVAFTLVEVVVSIAILALVMAGMIQGYIQTNRRAEWSSMSLAAQSFASQWAEQARAAKWDTHFGNLNSDQLPAPTTYHKASSMLIPGTDQQVAVDNLVQISKISDNPPVRQIRVDCMWQFPPTGQNFENTVITWRGAR